MRLIELIETQKIVSIYVQTHKLNGQKDIVVDIGAVVIYGWERQRNGIMTGVILTDKYSVSVRCPELSANDEISDETATDKQLSDSQDMKVAWKKLKEFVGENILLGYNIEQTCDILNCLGKRFGIIFRNKLLDTLAIAKTIYKDKIKDYSLPALAQRHGVFRDTFCALDNACITANLLGELALRDDEAHCNY